MKTLRSALALGSLLALCLHALPAAAEEGMWLPTQLAARAEQMKSLGLELPAEQLADLAKAPLNAIVNLGGCSASFVSADGLIITNHHCAESALQYVTNDANDRLRDGFLAGSRAEELWAGPGTNLLITTETVDVTADMQQAIRSAKSDAARFKALDLREKEIVKECEATPGMRCSLVSEMGGNQYRLIKARELRDVRLVAAPPEMVGFYGGDVDNWMWPRHCGDFAFFRAYVGPDGTSSDFDEKHVPFQPPSFLKVAKEPLEQGDFVMVAGYPGETSRLVTAEEFSFAEKVEYPWQIETMQQLIKILDEVSELSESNRARLRPSRFGLANYEKNNRGMLDGFRSSNVVARVTARDAALGDFKGSNELKAEILRRQEGYERDALLGWMMWTVDLLGNARLGYWLAREKEKQSDLERDQGYQERDWSRLSDRVERGDAEFVLEADKRLFVWFLNRAAALPANARIEAIDRFLKPYGATPEAIAKAVDELYAKTSLLPLDAKMRLLETKRADIEASSDPALKLIVDLYPLLRKLRDDGERESGADARLRPAFVAALLKAQGNNTYADANSTLRITYGTVRGYDGPDGSFYKPFTTLAGITAKHTGEEPFDAPKPLLDAIASGDQGGYRAPELGTVPVNFLSTLDTTGGNSGSATLNGRGELVGLLFDGNYESMAADWLFDTANTRSLHVDIRYVGWYLDRVMGAGNLLRELAITPSFAK